MLLLTPRQPSPLVDLVNVTNNLPDTPTLQRTMGDFINEIRTDIGAPVLTPQESLSQMVASLWDVCITGDLGILLDVIDIAPISISVAIEGVPSSSVDCITKRGLLPLTMTNGSHSTNPASIVRTLSKLLSCQLPFWRQVRV
jgi:hypothetical protein